MVCGILVCVSLSVNVCMFTVSNALLMSNATAIVRVGGLGWLKPVATVLLMLCSGSNDSRLHVVEPPRGRYFIWQIGVNSSIQDRRQVDRSFFMESKSVVRGNTDSLLN